MSVFYVEGDRSRLGCTCGNRSWYYPGGFYPCNEYGIVGAAPAQFCKCMGCGDMFDPATLARVDPKAEPKKDRKDEESKQEENPRRW